MATNTRTLYSNARALFAIQIANYILPFLLIPYLTRVLGVPLYGIIAFGLAMVQIACVFTDYGFGLSATYQIAKQQTNKHALRKIISAVMICKAGLLIPVIISIGMFIHFQEAYAEYKIYFWMLLLPIIGQTFQPIWFFQGIERMTFITIYTVLSRTLYLALVVWLVSTPADFFWVAIANGFAHITASIIGIGMMLRMGYTPLWPGFTFVKQTFKDSTEFFWSRAAVATYTVGGVFFLGLTSSPTQVAYYSAAEQLYRGAQSLFQPISQALYPHMAKNRNFKIFFRVLKWSTGLSIIGVVIGILIGPWALIVIFGPKFSQSYTILVIFMITFTITTPSILLGYPFLGALGDRRSANLSVIFAGILQALILLTLYLTNSVGAMSVALSILTVEIGVLAYRIRKSKNLLKTLLNTEEPLTPTKLEKYNS